MRLGILCCAVFVIIATRPFVLRSQETQTVTTVPVVTETPVLKTNDKTTVSLSAKIHTGWSLDRKDDGGGSELENTFEIRKARLKLKWTPTNWLAGVIQVDAAQLFENGSSVLRDAYIHIAPLPQLAIRVGQFKKPFSALKLRSSDKLRIIRRGPGNDHLVEDLRYGDRDLGFQLSGRLIPSVKLDYEIGLFNGSGPSIDDWGNSKDLVGRLEIRPHKTLQIGANGTYKFIDSPNTEQGQPDYGWAAGGDIRLKIKGFRLFSQGLIGADYNLYSQLELSADNPPLVLDVLAVASYRHTFPLSWKFAVEPAIKGEILDPFTRVKDDTVYVLTVGINTYLSKYFRIMLNGEFIRTSSNTLSDSYVDKESLMVLLCLDI